MWGISSQWEGRIGLVAQANLRIEKQIIARIVISDSGTLATKRPL